MNKVQLEDELTKIFQKPFVVPPPKKILVLCRFLKKSLNVPKIKVASTFTIPTAFKILIYCSSACVLLVIVFYTPFIRCR